MRFLIFTGQGSQFVGMIKDLYDNFDIVRQTVRIADQELGFSLSSLMFYGPKETLTLTQNAQPAILVSSIAIYNLLKAELNFDFDITAGHSLGQYTSLVACESISLSDAIYAVYNRGKFMQEAIEVGSGAMMAYVGSQISEVENISKEISKDDSCYCDVANYNTHNQIIVSGYKKGVEKLREIIARRNLGKAIMLDVSAPFHCKLMKPVIEKMEAVLDNIKINPAKKVVIENVSSKTIQTPKEIKVSLLEQIAKPVKWVDNVEKALKFNIDSIVECGPKDILTSMLKRSFKTLEISGIFDLKSYNTYRQGYEL